MTDLCETFVGRDRLICLLLKSVADEDGTPFLEMLKPLVCRESFDNDSPDGDGIYTISTDYSGSLMGLGIQNNSALYILTVRVGNVSIPIQPGDKFYNIFDVHPTISFDGTQRSFDGFLEFSGVTEHFSIDKDK